MTSAIETEVKLRIGDLTAIRMRLAENGFQISREREFESNTLYDTAERALMRGGMILRLRQTGDRSVITWKGTVAGGKHKSRPERETTIGSVEMMSEILTALGFRPMFRYEKYRTEYGRPGNAGVVVIDETPIGTFAELEGDADWIDETARKLGYAPADYVLESYGALYRQYCQERNLEPTNMVFAAST